MQTATRLWRRLAPAALVAAAALALTACSIDKKAAPSLAGPSEFGLAVTMTASPDQLPRDGSSQSVVTLTVRDGNGQPVSGQRISLSLPVSAPAGAALSRTDVTTDARGTATFAVTAPQTGSLGDILVNATPVGSNFDNAVVRTLSIGVVPSNTTAPTVQPFSVVPATPEVGVPATLTAGAAVDEGVNCSDTCTFDWSFGDGSTATGRTITHTFGQVGDYRVTLTVTDRGGAATPITQTVTVVGIAPPTVSFSAAPATPLTGQETTFTADATTQNGHRVATFAWNWGDGTTNQSGSPIIRHTYTTAGTYLVVLTVTDDRGLATRTQKSVVVSTGLTSLFVVTPTTPKAGVAAAFDASTSSSQNGSAISAYTWDFGDGQSASGSSPIATHAYAAQGTYIVTLTITDGQSRTATSTKTVTVTP